MTLSSKKTDTVTAQTYLTFQGSCSHANGAHAASFGGGRISHGSLIKARKDLFPHHSCIEPASLLESWIDQPL